MNDFSFNERLEKLMDYLEITPTQFADKIGVQRSSISHLLSGRNNPSLDFVVKVLDSYSEINFDWLVKGKGSMVKDINTKPAPMSTTPTLFDQIFLTDEEKSKSTVKSIEKDKNQEKPQQSIENVQKTKKPIDRLLVLYKDGSFETFYNTEG